MSISFSLYTQQKKKEMGTLKTKLFEEINEIKTNNSEDLGILEEKAKTTRKYSKKLKGYCVF